MITVERLKEVLRYGKATGDFVWRVRSSSRVYAGMIAGCNRNGYVVITIDSEDYYGHQLAWLYETGTWPRRIDHRNRKRNDNRFRNLRLAGSSLNRLNSKVNSNNTTGFRGVSQKANGKYRADFRGQYLGTFTYAIDAAKAYRGAGGATAQ